MRRLGIISVAVLALACVGDGATAQEADKPARGKLEGTWELVSFKYGDDNEFHDAPKDQKRIKIVNATHFIWIGYGADNKTATSLAGGSYTFRGDDYVEKIEFGSADVEPLFGKDQKFKARIEGDQWFHSGTLSSGLKLQEIWKRVK